MAKPIKAPYFPETSSKAVAYWLLGSAASVFGIVVFGGLTRLTESGYVCHGVPEASLLIMAQSQHHRMAARDWIPATNNRGAMG